MTQMIGYQLLGRGAQHVIVLEGWFGDYTVFAPMFSALDLDTFTFAFMDYRGYGCSKDQEGAYNYAEIAADVLALADHLAWPTFHVLGHSMGGKAAQWLAAYHADRLRRVVMLTPVAAAAVPLGDAMALFAGAAESTANRRMILDVTTGQRLAGTWLDVMTEASELQTTVEAFAAYFHTWQASDFAADLQNCTVPMLVLAGQYDNGVPLVYLQSTLGAWNLNCSIEEIPNVGHYPMQESPIFTATRIQQFMLEQ